MKILIAMLVLPLLSLSALAAPPAVGETAVGKSTVKPKVELRCPNDVKVTVTPASLTNGWTIGNMASMQLIASMTQPMNAAGNCLCSYGPKGDADKLVARLLAYAPKGYTCVTAPDMRGCVCN